MIYTFIPIPISTFSILCNKASMLVKKQINQLPKYKYLFHNYRYIITIQNNKIYFILTNLDIYVEFYIKLKAEY